MKDLLSAVCLVLLAVLPWVVLGVRFVRPRLMPWWAAFSTTVGLGWGLALAGAMLNESSTGGAGHVGALFFGWAIALAWFLPWLLVYAIVQWIRRRVSGRTD